MHFKKCAKKVNKTQSRKGFLQVVYLMRFVDYRQNFYKTKREQTFQMDRPECFNSSIQKEAVGVSGAQCHPWTGCTEFESG